MASVGTTVKNTAGFVFLLFLTRLVDSLSTVVFQGERLSTKITNMVDNDTTGSA